MLNVFNCTEIDILVQHTIGILVFKMIYVKKYIVI